MSELRDQRNALRQLLAQRAKIQAVLWLSIGSVFTGFLHADVLGWVVQVFGMAATVGFAVYSWHEQNQAQDFLKRSYAVLDWADAKLEQEGEL